MMKIHYKHSQILPNFIRLMSVPILFLGFIVLPGSGEDFLIVGIVSIFIVSFFFELLLCKTRKDKKFNFIYLIALSVYLCLGYFSLTAHPHGYGFVAFLSLGTVFAINHIFDIIMVFIYFNNKKITR